MAMTFEILMSCMNQHDMSIIEKSEIKTNALVVNQCDKDGYEEINCGNYTWRMIYTKDRGLSKSRNKAIESASADICLIADDDELFDCDVEKKVLDAFERIDADVIAFEIRGIEKRISPKIIELGLLQTLRVSSIQIAFKRSYFIKNDIRFDELLGSGTDNGAGEESKLLWNLKKKKCKIFFVPITIGSVDTHSESAWFKGFDEKYFEQRGRTTRYFMGKTWAMIYGVYFLLTKAKIYGKQCSIFKAFNAFFRGYFKSIENE